MVTAQASETAGVCDFFVGYEKNGREMELHTSAARTRIWLIRATAKTPANIQAHSKPAQADRQFHLRSAPTERTPSKYVNHRNQGRQKPARTKSSQRVQFLAEEGHLGKCGTCLPSYAVTPAKMAGCQQLEGDLDPDQPPLAVQTTHRRGISPGACICHRATQKKKK